MKHTQLLLLLLVFIGTSSRSLDAICQHRPKAIRLATYQYGTNTRLENLAPLAKSIELLTGHPVEIKSYPNIEDFVHAIQGNQVDVALTSTMGYFLLRQDRSPQIMEANFTLTVDPNAIEQYKTAFIVPGDSKLTSIDNSLPSKKIHLGLVSSSSTSGNLIPRLFFAEVGLSPLENSFKKITYLGSHSAAIDAAAKGEVDLAALGSADYFNYIKIPEQATKVKLIMLSKEIPLGPVLLNKSLKTKPRERIKQLFLTMHKTDIATLSAIKAGWTEAKDAEKYIEIDSSYYDPYFNMFIKSN